MNESQRAVLRRYHQKLADDLVVTEELLGEMFQEGIFPLGMIDLIRVGPNFVLYNVSFRYR